MIYCVNCGKGIPDQSKFCTFCGAPVVADQPPVNPTADISQQPYVSTPAEPSQPQIVTPTLQPHVTQQYVKHEQPIQYVKDQPVKTKNEFYKNVGFWAAVIVVVGFFLPYVTSVDASFYYLVSDLAPNKPELYLYLVFPVSAGVIIIQGLTGILPKFLVVIFKILPVLMLILFAISISDNTSSFASFGNDIGTILSNIGVGLYMTVIGTIFMLFFRTTKTKV